MDTSDSNTRDRLLEAAVAVVDAHGVEGIRVRDIAAAANVREPSVYHYFGSREGLVEAVEVARFTRDLTQITNLFSTAVGQCTTAEEFVALCRKVMSATESPERQLVRSVRASVYGSAQSRPALAALISEAQLDLDKDLAKGFDIAKVKGWVRPDLNSVTFAAWISGMVNGRIILEMNESAYSTQSWSDFSTDSVLFGLGYVNDKPSW
jgi:AcrR family transcriptional regulator